MKEAETMRRLNLNGGHDNIVKFLRHGWFPDQSYFYIDLQLCDFNLEEHIRNDSAWASAVPTSDVTKSKFSLKDGQTSRKFDEIMDIIQQLARGVKFLHSQNAIHRDLKPRNGEHLTFFVLFPDPI